MRTTYRSKLDMAIDYLYLACIVAFTVSIAYNQFELISHEFPLDYNETGMLVITSTIAHGGNPFSLENQPAHMSVYPVLYNMLVAPLSTLFGNTLELHRGIVALFIIACSALCFYLCRRQSVPRTESFVAAALVYAGLLFYSTPIASPNSLGLFLFLCAITVPWVNGFSTRSLCMGILLGILGFYTKQYFIACLGYVALYIFLAVSKKRAVYFSLAALISFCFVLAVVRYTSPYFIEDVFFSPQAAAKFAASNKAVLTQSREFALINIPILIMMAVGILYRWRSGKSGIAPYDPNTQKFVFAELWHLDKPLLRHKPNYIWVCCVCSVLIVVLFLGRNRGNHLTYIFQLISPFLLVGIFTLISGVPKWRSPFRFLMVLALFSNYSMLSRNFTVDEANWRVVRKEIANADDIYASTLVLKEVVEKGATVYQNGHSRYFPLGKMAPSLFAKTENGQTVDDVWERYVRFIQSKIKNQEFDLLLIDHWMQMPKSLQESAADTELVLQQYYERTAVIKLPLANRPGGGSFAVQVWKPIPTIPGPGNP